MKASVPQSHDLVLSLFLFFFVSFLKLLLKNVTVSVKLTPLTVETKRDFIFRVVGLIF